MGLFNWFKPSPPPDEVLLDLQRRGDEIEKKITSPVTMGDRLTFERRVAVDHRSLPEVIEARLFVLQQVAESRDLYVRAMKKLKKDGAADSPTAHALVAALGRLMWQADRICPGFGQPPRK